MSVWAGMPLSFFLISVNEVNSLIMNPCPQAFECQEYGSKWKIFWQDIITLVESDYLFRMAHIVSPDKDLLRSFHDTQGEIVPPLQQTICFRPCGPLSMLSTAQDCSYWREGALTS